MKTSKLIKCPVCAGAGFIDTHKDPTLVDLRRVAAKELRKKGLTMRDIQKVLGYKSVSTINFLLK